MIEKFNRQLFWVPVGTFFLFLFLVGFYDVRANESDNHPLDQSSQRQSICARLLANAGVLAPHLNNIPHENNAIARVLAGAPEGYAHYSAIDENTNADLGLVEIYLTLAHSLTGFGEKRLKWRLTHPNLDAGEITRFQGTFKYLTEAKAEWGKLRGILRSSRDLMKEFEEAFDPEKGKEFLNAKGKANSIFYHATLMLNGYLAANYAWAGKISLPVLFVSGAFGALAHGNLRRNRPYRAQILTMRDFLNAADQLADALLDSKDPFLRSLGTKLDSLLAESTPLGEITQRLSRVGSLKTGLVGDTLVSQALWSLRSIGSSIRENLSAFAEVIDVFAEVDYFTGLTLWIHEHQEHLAYPEIIDSETPFIRIEDGHQGYLISETPEQSIPNSFDAKVDGEKFFILTGPHKAGKSTYVRMINLLALMAQNALPVPVRGMRSTPFHIMTNMEISDSLTGGKSFYDAESDRLGLIFKVLDSGVPTLLGLDEILLGTNHGERQAAEKSFIKYAAARKNITILALHDETMTQLEDQFPGVVNLHLDEELTPTGQVHFPKKVRRGPSPHRNGIRLLREKQFPKEFLDDADAFFREMHGGHAP